MDTSNRAATLDIYVDRLIQERQFPELDQSVMAEIKSDLMRRAENHVNATILAHIPPDQLEGFEKLIDTNASREELDRFCRTHIPNLDEVVAAGLLRFKQVYLGNK